MATLRHVQSRNVRPVPARMLVGRGSSCSLRLDDKRVSGEHATILWNGVAWVVRDLGSRNGTFVDGRRLGAGVMERVASGSRLGFGGDDDPWEVVDVGPPGAIGVHVVSGEIAASTGGILALPADAPRVVVFEDGRGRWLIEDEDGARPVSDGDVVQIGVDPWRIRVPDQEDGTATGFRRPTIDMIRLRFEVSRDEEFVRVTVVHPSGEIALEPREHAYTLLTLARARIEDAAQPPSEQGWVERDTLLRMLGMDTNALNVAIYRARSQLLEARVEGAAGVVEVRRGKRRLGIDPDRIDVRPLD